MIAFKLAITVKGELLILRPDPLPDKPVYLWELNLGGLSSHIFC